MARSREAPRITSLAVASDDERAHILQRTAVERDWYAGARVYKTNAEIVHAYMFENTDLQLVLADENIAPVYRLRHPGRRHEFPPFLTRQSARAMATLGVMWRQELLTREIDDPSLRLAATSLIRSDKKAKELAADPTKLAVAESSHRTGAAFDIDASGYYTVINGEYVPVLHPDRPKTGVAKISDELKKGDPIATDMPKAEVDYNPEVLNALLKVSEVLHELGYINRVVEYADANVSNQCLHIAPNPNMTDWLIP